LFAEEEKKHNGKMHNSKNTHACFLTLKRQINKKTTRNDLEKRKKLFSIFFNSHVKKIKE
jgi:hypothetical protein